jgi:hypothetical protein
MTVYIFTGPTLHAAEGGEVLDAVYLPPAARGDVYRVARMQPQAIGIVDGYFDTMPSIWHKEILWAMRQGVHVFGCASMGALRAAELAAFGMEGVGAIFEAYRDGELEDDDEVAVVHAPAEKGYRALSVALVNIRATLAAAEAQQIILPPTRAALVQLAKEMFYPDRSYPRLLEAAATIGLGAAELDALHAWLPRGQVDQKREDALAMLRTIRERLAAGLQPKSVRYHFEHTIFWEHVRQTVGEAGPGAQEDSDHASLSALLDEARLDPTAYRLARQGTIARALAQALTEQQGQRATPERVEEAILSFRRARGLLQAEAMAAWLQDNELVAERFAQLMEEAALVHSATSWAVPSMTSRLVEQLRLDGTYPQLRERERHKQQVLEQAGLANPGLDSAGLTREELLRWHFAARGDGSIPLDLNQYVVELGYRDEHLFIRALLREFCYQRLANTAAG